MFSRQPRGGPSSFGLGVNRGPFPRDLIVLLAVLFATFSLQFFAATRFLPELLRLSPSVWRSGFIWQLATYAFVGTGAPGIWFLLELFILALFARDVFLRLGRRDFWRLVGWGVVTAALVAVVVELAAGALGGGGIEAFGIMQGQRMLVVVVIAAFATLYSQATIYLFFVLPIQARWFLWLEILFAFMAFLGTRDLAGFLGICAAVGLTYNILSAGRLAGGLRRQMRELWLRMEQQRIKAKLARLRKKRGLHIVPDEKPKDGDRDPWVH